MRSHPTSRVFGLDLLRAAAIVMVICAHGFVVLYPHFGEPLAIFGHGGFYGVELFFVLSGFLIGQILIRNGNDLGQGSTVAFFYVRRWFRTLPLFFSSSSSTSCSSVCSAPTRSASAKVYRMVFSSGISPASK